MWRAITRGVQSGVRVLRNMPSNVEIKAKLADREKAIRVAKELSASEGTTLDQEDTFFTVPNGRLKLRVQKGLQHKLIAYSRDDIAGPKLSKFTIAIIENPEELKAVLTESLGIVGCVKKTRLLFLVGQTRIHIDTVEGLGDFLELEVVMREGHDQAQSEGQKIAEELQEKLGIPNNDLITCAYMDLLRQKNT